jgi:DNA polymerase elongation subunit (family B)
MTNRAHVNIQPYDWTEKDMDHLSIRMWGLDKESKPNLIRIENFKPYIFAELPSCVGSNTNFKWTSHLVGIFKRYLCFVLKGDAPTMVSIKPSKDLYYFQGDIKKSYVRLVFDNLAAQKHAIALLNRDIDFRDGKKYYGGMRVTTCEQDISSIRKMLTARNCDYSGWMKISGSHPMPRPTSMGIPEDQGKREIKKDALGNIVMEDLDESHYAISTLPIEQEWIVDWTDLTMSDPEEVKGIITHPKLLAFDLECYSDNHKIFVRRWNDLHVTFMNSVVVQVAGKPETKKMYGIVVGDVNEIPDDVIKDVTIIRVSDQIKLVHAMADLIREHDPDVITGYNINDFDFLYIDAKLQSELEAWPNMGRLVDEPTELKSWDWESGGAGFNSVNILKAAGRIPIDMYTVIKRDWKLVKYTLDTVADRFLDRRKNDVTPVEMFTSFERSRDATSRFNTTKYNIFNTSEIPESNDWLYECQKKEKENEKDEWKFAHDRNEDGEEGFKEATSGFTFSKEATKEFGHAVSNIIKDTSHSLRDYVKTIDTPKAFEKWKASMVKTKTKTFKIPGIKPVEVEVDQDGVITDNYNEPRKGGMYNRFGKLNWCSNEYYACLLDIATQNIEQHEWRRPEWAVLTNDVLSEYIVGGFLMTRVLEYCMVDSDITIDLFDKLHTWVGLIQMSKVAGVSVIDIFTRGQQVRCLSRLYDIAAKRGVVLSKRAALDIFFNGGFVFHPIPGLYDAIVVDFNSLYPSIMKEYNIDHTTLVAPEHFGKFPEHLVHTIRIPRPDKKAKDGATYDTDQPEDKYRNEEDEGEDNSSNVIGAVKTSMSNIICDEEYYYVQFVKKEVVEGLFPAIVRELINDRKEVRAEQAKFEEESIEWLILEKLQLALKVVANSTFGFMGAGKQGKRSLIEGSMAITAVGRELIKQVNAYCEKKYGAVIRYGDSVTPDTPILCRYRDHIFYLTIDNLPSNPWSKYGHKEICDPEDGLEVWSDQGFTLIKKIIRHKTNKKIYRITTHTGSVKVTEDHSLLDPSGNEVKPKDVKVGTELMSRDLPMMSVGGPWDIFETKDDNTELSKAIGYHYYTSTLGSANVYLDKDGIGIRWSDDVYPTDVIQQIEDLGYSDDYVYDIETDNHHFAAGVGRLIVHNTDSSMVDLHLKDPKEFNKIGKALAAELSDLFGDELKLEMEKVLRAIFIKAKFYVGYVYDDDGNFKIDKKTKKPFLYTRGVILSRRDYPKYAQFLYEKIARDLLDKKPIIEVLIDIISGVKKLLRGEIDYNDLIIVKGVSNSYKQATYYMKMFSDKMTNSGKPIKPGERVGYIVHKPRNAGEEKYMGMRMVTPELYEESKGSIDPMEIDYTYYLTKQMTNNIDSLFYAGVNRSLGKYDILKVRRTKRCKYVSLITPMKFIGSMINGGYSVDDLDLILEDIKAIDEGRDEDVILKDGYDRPQTNTSSNTNYVSMPNPVSHVTMGKQRGFNMESLRIATEHEMTKKRTGSSVEIFK